jgi:hypothetical protein
MGRQASKSEITEIRKRKDQKIIHLTIKISRLGLTYNILAHSSLFAFI